MTNLEIKQAAEKIRWWHKIELYPGFITPGFSDISALMANSGIPSDLTGKRCLDIGTWDGAVAFEMERRGAAEVVAIDSWDGMGRDWKGDPFPAHPTFPQPYRDGFNLACRALSSKVQGWQLSVMDVHPLGNDQLPGLGFFDIVVMFGVLYHLRHPLMAIERVRSVCRDLLILETYIDMLDEGRPATAFYGKGEVNNDPTTWWGPNVECVNAWLLSSGFSTANYHYSSGTRGIFHARVS